jgi:hypothetical protein
LNTEHTPMSDNTIFPVKPELAAQARFNAAQY